jgi:small subunit ribosomal protein S20
MPNTKSAARRVRSSARRQLHNKSIKSKLKTLEKNYLDLAHSGDKDKASAALRSITSALDKAAKAGVLHSNTTSRKKSRLALKIA